MNRKKYEAFSLIEILVVVALIIILATITIVAINPGKNFRDTRNAQRSADVNAILSAVSQYTTDGKGLPDIEDCDPDHTDAGDVIGTDGVNLADYLTAEGTQGNDYMVSIPMDPGTGAANSAGTEEDTGYVICKIGTRIQIAAPKAEGEDKEIAVRR